MTAVRRASSPVSMRLFQDDKENSLKRRSMASMTHSKLTSGMLSGVSASLQNIAQSVAEELSATHRAQSSDNLADVKLDQFEPRIDLRRNTVHDLDLSKLSKMGMPQGRPKPPPLQRRAASCHGAPSSTAPPRPPRPAWMKKTPEKRRAQLAMGMTAAEIEAENQAIDDMILPYASNVSIRAWAKPRIGNEPREPESGYSSRASSTSPAVISKVDTHEEIYDKEYEWGGAVETPSKYNHDSARFKVNALVSPEKPRPEGKSTTSLMEILDEVSRAMAESGSWRAASRIAQDRNTIKRVQGSLDATGIKPNEASATELLTALLSCFEE